MTIIGKPDLIAHISCSYGIEKATVQKVLDSSLEAIKTVLASGQEIRLMGFSSFVVQESKERMGRNPRTGEPLILPASKRVSFRMGRELRDAINGRKLSRSSKSSSKPKSEATVSASSKKKK